ncbi:acyltransferase [Zunongwangia pacifica]|uniref:Acyltransferase n=1 Tax=Zunongwangia pacifica TaxID=2911062 RepID=A0A9X2CN98_9FLAO|nr:acyltransferase [Zunongwangia pacifica]MCL6216753.1 acyltransferase [Zunongwangia pacifica]
MIKKIVKKIRHLKWIFFSLEKQACSVGVQMGKNNFIASKFWSTEPYLITIGSNCQITNGVKFFTHGGAGAVRKFYPEFDCFGKIKLGDYVYIGNNSLIMPGVSIGDNVLIAAGSVVVKSIPDNCVVGGNPASFICTIDSYINKNKKFNLNTKKNSASEKKKILLSLSTEKFIKKRDIKINSIDL